MKQSRCTNYDDLPLFLNAHLLSEVLGVSISTAYEVMHEPGFPVLHVAATWWCRKRSLFSGRRSSLDARNEKAELAQVGPHQELFSSAQ